MHESHIRKDDWELFGDEEQQAIRDRIEREHQLHDRLLLMERRITELEQALLPFANVGKYKIATTEEFSSVYTADCIHAFKTLFKTE